MIRRFPGGRSMRTHYVVTSVMAIALAACTGARSPGGPDEGALLRETGLPAGVAARAERPPDPGRSPKDAGPASAAALNSRLMEQAARSSQETDLPVVAGALLEDSVFEVEELSKIRLRVPGRGVIALPLIGQIQATGRTTAEQADRQVYVIRRAPMAVVTAAANGAAPPSGSGTGGDGTAEVMAPIDLSELADGHEDLNVQLRSG